MVGARNVKWLHKISTSCDESSRCATASSALCSSSKRPSHQRRSPWQQSDYKLYRIHHPLQLHIKTSVNMLCSYPQTVRTLAAAKGSMSLPIQSTPVSLSSHFMNQFAVLSLRRSSARLSRRLQKPL